MQRYFLKILFLVVASGAMLLTACSADPRRPREVTARAVDFSGAWEVDHSRSDNIRDRYDAMTRELQRQFNKRAQNMGQASGTVVVNNGTNTGASLIGLARMAEVITDTQLLDITQSETKISVKREGNFALRCEFHQGQIQKVQTPLGTEVCGWDDHQLIFQIHLPEGLSVHHRLTMGSEAQRLRMSTTVISDRVSYPFTLNRVFNRYNPSTSGITCKQTLTRGRVCTTEGRGP